MQLLKVPTNARLLLEANSTVGDAFIAYAHHPGCREGRGGVLRGLDSGRGQTKRTLDRATGSKARWMGTQAGDGEGKGG